VVVWTSSSVSRAVQGAKCFFDILGPGDVDYMGLTFVAEVTHKYSGRAVCVGPSIPYVRKSGGLVWA